MSQRSIESRESLHLIDALKGHGYIYKAILILLVAIVFAAIVRVYLSLGDYRVPLNHIYYLEDPFSSLTLEQVKNHPGFVNGVADFNKGYSASTYWVQIDPGYLNPGDYVLSLNYSALNKVTLYHNTNAGEHRILQSGLDVEREKWPLKRDDIMFPISDLATDSPLWLKISSSYSVQATFEILTKEAAYLPSKKILWGAFYGCLLVMFFYNANIFFGIEDKSYFYYSLHTFFAILAFVALSGHGHWLWPELKTFHNYSITVTVSLYWLAALLFCSVFLNLKSKARTLYRCLGVCWLSWVGILLYSLLNKANLSTLTTPFSILTCLLTISAGLKCISDTFAKYFVFAWSVYLVHIISMCFGYLGWVPRNTFTAHAAQFGQLFETLFLAFALAARVRQLRVEKLHESRLREQTSQQLLQMTQQKYDATMEAAEVKDRFLATLSHEMKTPLHGIITPLCHLLENSGDDDTKENLELSIDSANRMKVMLDRLLRLSDLEAGRLNVSYSPINFIDSCSMLASLIKNYCESKGLSFTYLVGKNVPQYVITDGKNLIEVLRIFLENAVKYTDSGCVQFGIFGKSNQVNNEESHINFFVSDTGIGINEKNASKLFSKFMQVEDGSNRRFGGLGIDLAVAQHILDQLQGNVKFTSTVNQGTSFHIQVPIQVTDSGDIVELTDYRYEISKSIGEAKDKRPIDAALTQPIDSLMNAKKKVLVVDDDVTNQMIAKKVLEKLDLNVSVAADGNECIQCLDSDDYDLVLMDCQMPVKDGYEATREIRQSNSHYNKVPIIAVTANSMEGDRQKCLDTGMDDYIAKPYSPTLLRDCVERWCQQPSLTDSQLASPAADSSQAKHIKSNADAKRLLLIEDDEANQYITTKIVHRMGYAITVAGNGKEGLKKLNSESFDLILMDCHMPEMDGYHVSEKIRALDDAKAKIPIIALTVASSLEDQEKCLQAGMDDHLSKPYSGKELEEKIDYWLSAGSSLSNVSLLKETTAIAKKSRLAR